MTTFSINSTSRFLLLTFISLSVLACQSQNVKPDQQATDIDQQLIHQESTVYFADKTASISLRASFNKKATTLQQPLASGYILQLRSINRKHLSISQMSIIAGGEKITISDENFFIVPQQAINLELSLEDSQYINQQADALLRFKFDGASQLISIQNHKIETFLVQQ